MVDTKSCGYSNSGRLSEGEYSMPFFSTRHSPTSDCDRKASVCWSAPYEANSVAPETSLACAGTSGEGNSGPQVSPSSFGLVVGRQQCSSVFQHPSQPYF